MLNADLITEFLWKFSWLGSWLFFLLAFLESWPIIGLIIPGATLISFGGFLASQGYLDVRLVILAAFAGAAAGDFLNYLWGGHSRRWFGLAKTEVTSQASFITGQKLFNRYGAVGIFLGRFLGPLKQIIPFVAGLSRMSTLRFLIWDSLSILAWAAGYALLGYFTGTLFGSFLEQWADNLLLVGLIILGAVLIFWLVKKIQQAIIVRYQIKNLGIITRFSRFRWFRWLSRRFPSWERFLAKNENDLECFLTAGLLILVLAGSYWLFIS
jgi:membrane protein DedA with SNARE-associated domain